MILLFISIVIALLGYKILYQSRFLFSERFGFIVSKTGSMLNSMILSIQVFFMLESSFLTTSIFNVALGMMIGVAFGTLVNSQSLIVGIVNGIWGSLMGTMVGAVALDPSICSIPSQFTSDQLVLFFGLMGMILQAMVMFLICYALRV